LEESESGSEGEDAEQREEEKEKEGVQARHDEDRKISKGGPRRVKRRSHHIPREVMGLGFSLAPSCKIRVLRSAHEHRKHKHV
jgi:hypothetical protein